MGVCEEESDPTRLHMGTIALAAQGRKDGRKVRQEMGDKRRLCSWRAAAPGGNNHMRGGGGFE